MLTATAPPASFGLSLTEPRALTQPARPAKPSQSLTVETLICQYLFATYSSLSLGRSPVTTAANLLFSISSDPTRSLKSHKKKKDGDISAARSLIFFLHSYFCIHERRGASFLCGKTHGLSRQLCHEIFSSHFRKSWRFRSSLFSLYTFCFRVLLIRADLSNSRLRPKQTLFMEVVAQLE